MAICVIANDPPPIGIDIGNGSWTDEGESNPTGLQITPTSFSTVSTGGGEKTTTLEGITFLLNPGGAQTVGAWADYSNLNDEGSGTRYSAAVPWSFTGLQPGRFYNLVFLSGPAAQPGKFTINGIGAATPDAEGDGNFEKIEADGSGMIEGTYDVWASNTWSTITAVMLEIVPPPQGMVITLK
jgi:hypothetical protein